MSDRRRRPTVLVVLVLLSLAFITADYRQGGGGFFAAVQRGGVTVFGPVQDGIATIVRPIGGAFGSAGDYLRLRDRNAELEAEVDRLRTELGSRADLERENADLRAMLAMRDRLGVTTVGAQVIAGAPSQLEWSLLLDAGADDGLTPGMAVLDADGLVGRLTEVTARNARVQLLSSPDAGYVVRLADTGVEGMLSGRGSEPFQLEVLDPEATVVPGTEVVTRAYQGTTIPDGLPVGEVGPARPEGTGRFVTVLPYVDFNRLNHVQVVVDAPEHPRELPADELIEDPDPPRPPPPGAVDEAREDDGAPAPPVGDAGGWSAGVDREDVGGPDGAR